jgi:hypothetical protein
MWAFFAEDDAQAGSPVGEVEQVGEQVSGGVGRPRRAPGSTPSRGIPHHEVVRVGGRLNTEPGGWSASRRTRGRHPRCRFGPVPCGHIAAAVEAGKRGGRQQRRGRRRRSIRGAPATTTTTIPWIRHYAGWRTPTAGGIRTHFSTSGRPVPSRNGPDQRAVQIHDQRVGRRRRACGAGAHRLAQEPFPDA